MAALLLVRLLLQARFVRTFLDLGEKGCPTEKNEKCMNAIRSLYSLRRGNGIPRESGGRKALALLTPSLFLKRGKGGGGALNVKSVENPLTQFVFVWRGSKKTTK